MQENELNEIDYLGYTKEELAEYDKPIMYFLERKVSAFCTYFSKQNVESTD